MTETIIYFFEMEEPAVAKFSFFRRINTPVLMIGPTTLLTPAGTKIEAVADDKEYYVVIATHADAVAAPAIQSPP